MVKDNNISKAVDEYILIFPIDIQDRMKEVRKIIHLVAPGVQEKISWGIPTFFIGKNRVHFAANKKHLGLYPGAKPIEIYKEELNPKYATSKGTVQLPYNQPLPLAIITKLIKAALTPM